MLIGCISIIIMLILFDCTISLIVTSPVMFLWNCIMSGVFGLPEISFWQAFGLLILCSLLINSIHINKLSKKNKP